MTNSLKTVVLFASQTGNAEYVAADVANALNIKNVIDMADFSADIISQIGKLLIVSSTYGDGEHPDGGEILWTKMAQEQSLDMSHIQYAVLGLGDTAYDLFCQSAIDWDKFLEKKGAYRAADVVKLDVDYEDGVLQWIESLQDTFCQPTDTDADKDSESATNSETDGDSSDTFSMGSIDNTSENTASEKQSQKYTKKTPFMGEILEIRPLTSQNSTKSVYHIAFKADDTDMQYQAGDCLGIIPVNSDKAVYDVIKAGGFDTSYNTGGQKLFDILRTQKEIRLPSKKILDVIATYAKITDMLDFVNQTNDKELWQVLTAYPCEIPTDIFLENLSSLQHRLYSIASSPKKYKSEIHLTVSLVQYGENNVHIGVASGFVTQRVSVGEKVPMFLHTNPAFSVPNNPTIPMIMIGAGTGIAPFIGFIQEREAEYATGLNWLFYGDRNQETDFLYKEQVQNWQKSGCLRLDTAWSRDGEKAYVQHKMDKKAKEIFAALEQGAYVYVCGDALHMAKDVEATLLNIIAVAGAMSVDKAVSYMQDLKTSKRYVKDVY